MTLQPIQSEDSLYPRGKFRFLFISALSLSHGSILYTTIEQDNSGEIEEREMKDMFCKLCRIVTREKEKLTVERTRAESEVPVATVLGSIPASVGTVESEGRQMKQC